MSHKQQQDYCKQIKAIHPKHFKGVNVIDVGSLNINGHNRDLFEDSTYTGVDIAPGSNVDVVSKAHEMRLPKADIVISTEMLEHDKYWEASLRNMVAHLKPGGMLLLTCAGPGRPEHGTRRCDKGCSPLTCSDSDESWQDYYRNLDVKDLWSVLEEFEWRSAIFDYDTEVHDTYFTGVLV